MYTATVLNRLGVPCGHEMVFAPWGYCRRPRFPLHGDCSWLAAPFLGDLPSSLPVVHQVRNPVLVIQSHMAMHFFRGVKSFKARMMRDKELWRESLVRRQRPSVVKVDSGPRFTVHEDYVAFLKSHKPEIFKLSLELDRCIAYWVDWNGLVEDTTRRRGMPYKRFRIEDLNSSEMSNLLKHVGYPDKALLSSAVDHGVPSTTNAGARDQRVTWEVILSRPRGAELAHLAEEYGYRPDTETT